MRVKFFATYRDITRTQEIQWKPEADVLALLVSLSAHFGGAFQGAMLNADQTDINQDTIVLVNGRHTAHLQGAHTELDDSDVVAIFPVIAGG